MTRPGPGNPRREPRRESDVHATAARPRQCRRQFLIVATHLLHSSCKRTFAHEAHEQQCQPVLP